MGVCHLVVPLSHPLSMVYTCCPLPIVHCLLQCECFWFESNVIFDLPSSRQSLPPSSLSLSHWRCYPYFKLFLKCGHTITVDINYISMTRSICPFSLLQSVCLLYDMFTTTESSTQSHAVSCNAIKRLWTYNNWGLSRMSLAGSLVYMWQMFLTDSYTMKWFMNLFLASFLLA